MKKRGMSGIIITLILIAISLAVVGIVWFVINGVIESSSSQINQSSSQVFQSCSGIGYTKMSDGDICNSTTTYAGGEKCCAGFNFQATAGLVSYWSFDVDARDDYGNNDGTVYGATWNSTGGFNSKGAYEFDGDDDFINITEFASATAPYSVSLWFSPKELNRSQSMFYFKGNEESYPSFMILSNSHLLAYCGGEKYRYGAKTFNSSDLNQYWHVVFVVQDGDSLVNWKVYLNGVDDTGSVGGNTGTYYEPGSWAHIGRRGGSFFNGTIDEIRIYDRTLNASEVSFLYNLN